MSYPTFSLLPGLALLLLAGCISIPNGPSVMALPGSGKSFEHFRRDDAECRRYAYAQVGGSGAEQAAVDAGVRSAAVGTAIGAVAGAAIGGRSGAAVGAGTGLLMGSVVGTSSAQSSAYGTQRNYDHAYVQCMYANGHQVPVTRTQARNVSTPSVPRSAPAASSYPPPPPAAYPPPGYPPPPTYSPAPAPAYSPAPPPPVYSPTPPARY